MLRKLSSRFIFSLNRSVSTQKPNASAKSVLQREIENRKESWTPMEDSEKQPEKELSERQKKLHDDIKRIDEFRNRDQPKEKWQSKFQLVFNKEPDMSLLIWMQQPWDFRPNNLRRLWEDWKLRKEAFMQSFMSERFEALGADLAVTHFILFRDGKIKLKGNSKWYTEADYDSLPLLYKPEYIVEAINFDNQPLHYEGVENITNLKQCKSISLRNTKHFDDWCLDRLAGNYIPMLEELDISGTDVTRYGFECLYKMPSLKRLIVDKKKMNSIEFQLIFGMLEEMKLDLNVLDSNEVKQDCPVDTSASTKKKK